MGNTYEIGKCPECKKHIFFDEGDQLTVTVVGSKALEEAMMLLEGGMSLDVLDKHICRYCRGVHPCGCEKPNYSQDDE